jgi:uncharacterized membrane protein
MPSHVTASVTPTEGRRWLIPTLAAVIAILVLAGVVAAIAASTSFGAYGWMMGGGTWSWMWGFGALMMMVPLVLLALLLVVLLRASSPSPMLVPVAQSADPLTEVRLRYARGEVSQEQYRAILRDLTEGHAPS